MSRGIRRRLPGRRLGLAAISGLLLFASAGVSNAALPAPDRHSEARADSSVTVDRGKAKTKKGKVSATLTYKIANKGPTATISGEFRATATTGVTFDKAPKGCAQDATTVVCPLERIKNGATKKLQITVLLTGTNHKVEATSSSDRDPNPQDNSLVLAWSTADPAPNPSPKPSGSPPAKSSKCPATRIEWSKDGGRTWNRGGLLGGFHAKLNVRLADKVDKKCQYKVSLASYSAEGPTWKTSGKQAFLGKHTVTLTGKKPTAVLDISRFMPPCYGQIDLYGSGEKFDGDRLPRYPDRKFPTRMIAGWNGGKACTNPPSSSPPPSSTSASPSPSPSPSASTSAPPSSRPPTTNPPTTAPPTSSAPPSTTPSTTPSQSPSTTPPSSTPTTTSPSSTPPPPPADTSQPPAEQVPVDDAPAPPGPDDQRNTTEAPYVDGDLPRTGADRIPYLIALAVFSLLLGALAIAWSRWGPRGAFGRTPAPAPAHAHAANPWINRPRNPWIN